MTAAVISLDLWGTVLDFGDRTAAAAWRRAEFGRVLTDFDHPVPADRLAVAFQQTGDQFARRQRQTGVQPTVGEQVTAILSAVDIPTVDDDLLRLLEVVHSNANLRACAEPTAGITGVLDQLRAAGYRLVLSSNTLTCPGTVTRRILDGHDLTGAFDRMFFSDELGTAKPHRGFFAAVTEAVGVRPGQILHVGDDWRTDVLGARAAGWRVVWFNPAGKPSPAGSGEDDVTELSDVSTLPRLATGTGSGQAVPTVRAPAPRRAREALPREHRR